MSYILFLDHQTEEVEPNSMALASMGMPSLGNDIKAAGVSVAYMFWEPLFTDWDSSEVAD